MSDYPLTSTWAEVDAAAQAVKNGLPKANLSGAVQASLEKADGAVQAGDQATKTSSMTQAVGVDSQGKLWVDSSTSVVCEISLDDDEYVCDTSFSDLADALAAHRVIECKTPEGLAFCQGFKGTNYYLITFTVQSASGSSLSLVQYQYDEGGTIERKVFTTGGGGGGDAELFWITITAFGGSFVMDCTWADIADAMSNGMLIVAKFGDRRYWWNGDPTDDGLQLVSVDVSSSSKAYAQAFTISDNGTISRKSNVSLNPSDLWLNTLSLSSSEKEKARGNIGAGTYSIPSGGIPSTDMSSAVQTSLGKADTAYQRPSGGIPEGDLAIYETTISQSGSAWQSNHSLDDIIDAYNYEKQLRFYHGNMALTPMEFTGTYITLAEVYLSSGRATLRLFAITSSGVGVSEYPIGNVFGPTADVVVGSTASITAEDNHVYSCGELSTLMITDSAQNISFKVDFTSGSTATVITVPSGYKAPGGDLTAEANKEYELDVRNGKAVLTAFEAVSA